MYANWFELRENNVPTKKEYKFDGYNWRKFFSDACRQDGTRLKINIQESPVRMYRIQAENESDSEC